MFCWRSRGELHLLWARLSALHHPGRAGLIGVEEEREGGGDGGDLVTLYTNTEETFPPSDPKQRPDVTGNRSGVNVCYYRRAEWSYAACFVNMWTTHAVLK